MIKKSIKHLLKSTFDKETINFFKFIYHSINLLIEKIFYTFALINIEY